MTEGRREGRKERKWDKMKMRQKEGRSHNVERTEERGRKQEGLERRIERKERDTWGKIGGWMQGRRKRRKKNEGRKDKRRRRWEADCEGQ